MRSDSSRDELNRFSDLEAEYEILRELGRGGTAVVYLARERALDRDVAIKVIRATFVEDDGAAARLIREARTVGQLQHPNIVMLYGTRRLMDGSLALIMQYVKGRTLKDEIRACGPLPFDRVERILLDLSRGLACAQKHRIVHRDIKPENIYLDDETGMARLSDFGIARPWDSDCSLTLPGMAIGTPAYMSPEQIDGTAVDGRSDIYSLGLVAWEMLTGRAPWAGETIYSTIYKQKHEDLPSLTSLRAGVPAKLRRVVEGALFKDPAQRWTSAEEMVESLTTRGGKARGGSGGKKRRGGRKTAGSAADATTDQEAVPPHETATIVYRRSDLSVVSPAADPADPAPAAKPRRRAARPAARPAAPPPAVEVGPAAASGHAKADVPGVPEAAEEPPVSGWQDGAAGAWGGDDHEATQPVRIAGGAEPRLRRLRQGVVAVLLASVLIGIPVFVALGPGTHTVHAGPDVTAITAENWAGTRPAVETAAAPVEDLLPSTGAAAVAFPLYGDVQEGTAGDTLPAPLVLRVEDAAGRPVAGAGVSFAVREGEGRVSPERAVTDEHGLATARWLPEQPGTHRVEATPDGTEEAVVFRARVLPRAGARLTAVGGPEQAGASSSRLVVRVDDERGQPVSGAEVRFLVRSGGGRVEPARAVTDREGLARAQWVLGRGTTQEAEARLNGQDGGVVFTAGSEPAAARVAIRSGVTAGGTHTCTLAGDGAAICWGGNDSGQLGDGSAGRRGGAVRVAAPEPFAVLAAGVSHTCGVTVSGSAYCWGSNTAGQLGDGTRVGRAQPARVRADGAFTQVFAGMGHSCGLDTDGRLHCWGENTHGQLGDGSRSSREAAVRVAGNRSFRTASVGWAHTCALTRDGAAWCWGRNSSGELGDRSTTDRTQPVAVAGGHRFSAIAVGSAHTCGLRSDGAILCWGQNSHGQLGSGDASGSTAPVAVSAPEPFTALTVGGVHSCGLGRSGAAFCWGRNTYGQLGDGTTQNRAQPVLVEGGLRFTSLQASGAHTCATSTDGADYCWGYNIEGQLGNGTRSNQARPARVAQRR